MAIVHRSATLALGLAVVHVLAEVVDVVFEVVAEAQEARGIVARGVLARAVADSEAHVRAALVAAGRGQLPHLAREMVVAQDVAGRQRRHDVVRVRHSHALAQVMRHDAIKVLHAARELQAVCRL